MKEIILRKHNKFCDVCKQPLIVKEPCYQYHAKKPGVRNTAFYRCVKCYALKLTASSISRHKRETKVETIVINNTVKVLERRKDGKVYVVTK